MDGVYNLEFIRLITLRAIIKKKNQMISPLYLAIVNLCTKALIKFTYFKKNVL